MKTTVPCSSHEAATPDGTCSSAERTGRYSKNRELVLACVKNTKCHPSVEWVYEQLKPEHPDLGLATVYRNLRKLVAEGTIRSLGVVEEKERFDGCVLPHVHAVCEQCGAVMDLPDAAIPDILKTCAETAGFAVSSVRIHVYGVCDACQKEGFYG